MEYSFIEHSGQMWVYTLDDQEEVLEIPYHYEKRIYDMHLDRDKLYELWECCEFDEWFEFTDEERKELHLNWLKGQRRVKKDMKINTLANCQAPASIAGFPINWVVATTAPMENNMNNYNQISDEMRQRQYLENRLADTWREKREEVKNAFGLTDDKTPQTPKELVARITSGKYTIQKEYEDVERYNPLDFIRWRDPAKKEDKDGFKAAVEKAEKLYTQSTDTIKIASPVDGLKALQEFESATFH